MIKDHQMVIFKWVVTYTACPLGKLTRIAKTYVLTVQRYEVILKVPNILGLFCC